MNELNNIPKHWQVKKLGEVCTHSKGKKPTNLSSDKNVECTIPYINIKAFEKGVLDDYTDGDKCNLCEDNDLLMVWDGARCGLIGKAKKGAVGSTLMKILPNENIHKEYLYHFINLKFTILNTKPKGVGIPHIEPTLLWNFELLLPPLPEQLAIVSKIEELLSDLENGKQQLLTAQQQLKVYRQSLLKAAFEGRLTNKEVKDGELPEGWKWVKLGDFISKIEAGKSFKCDERTPNINEVGVLKVSAVTWGVYNELESKTIIEKERYNQAYIVREGDFLFSRANTLDLIGAAVIAGKTNRQLMLSDKTLRFIFNYQINKYYALYYLRSQKGRREIQRLSTGNQESMRNIGQARINQIEIPIPHTLKEQHQIVEILESKLTVCDKIEETINQSLLQAETLKQSILKKAFEGRLVSVEEEKVNAKLPNIQLQFPKIVDKITTTDLHAGIISMVITAHEKNIHYLNRLNHVKCEKIAHMVEAKIGLSLGREPVKDAAGPDDYNHLTKVEHRANMANWFGCKKLDIGRTYYSKSGINNLIDKVRNTLKYEELNEIDKLIMTFLPFELEHAELIATIYAGWNNLLLYGQNPTDEEIVFESRENWSERKLTIERAKFFKTLNWMRLHGFIPEGKGKLVLKNEKVTKTKKRNL